MVAIIIINAVIRDLFKKKDWNESNSEDGHIFPVKRI